MTEKEAVEAEAQVSEEKAEVEAEAVEKVEEEAKEVEAAGEAEGISELERLREELEEVKAEAEEYLDGWRRAQAEFSNYKKRQQADRARVRKLANADVLRKLLPVVDDFQRATRTLPPELTQLTWCEGVFLIRHKLNAILESEGVEPIETNDKMFDPRYHEAVTHEEISGYEDGQIIREVQRGYLLGDIVLRPALVRVAKAPGDQAGDEGAETGEAVQAAEE